MLISCNPVHKGNKPGEKVQPAEAFSRCDQSQRLTKANGEKNLCVSLVQTEITPLGKKMPVCVEEKDIVKQNFLVPLPTPLKKSSQLWMVSPRCCLRTSKRR